MPTNRKKRAGGLMPVKALGPSARTSMSITVLDA